MLADLTDLTVLHHSVQAGEPWPEGTMLVLPKEAVLHLWPIPYAQGSVGQRYHLPQPSIRGLPVIIGPRAGIWEPQDG